MDLVTHVKSHPRPGDTVLGSDMQMFPGGKGANQAVAAAKAGASVKMLGKLGKDAHGKRLRDSLELASVDTNLVSEVDTPSGVAFITVDSQAQNMIVVSSGANRQLRPEDIHALSFEGIELILTQLESPLDTVEALATAAHQNRVPILLNAAPANDLSAELLSKLDYLVVNEGEAELLSEISVSDKKSAKEAAKKLTDKGVSNVIVTLGGNGLVWAGESESELEAHKVKVVDTTAAGDAFCGALAAHLSRGMSLTEALSFANAAGALATTKLGAQPSLPSQDDIETIMAASD